jgi:carboxyl-terminal processing protease
VALDTTGYSPATTKVYTKSIVNNFVYNYYLQNKAKLLSYKSSKDFATNFNLTNTDWLNFSSFAAKDSINTTKFSALEKDKINQNIKALIARQLYRTEGYFEIQNITDGEIRKALEVLGR